MIETVRYLIHHIRYKNMLWPVYKLYAQGL
jgi:hypothetical protein